MLGNQSLEVSMPLHANTPYHVVAVSDGVGQGSAFVNGVLAGSGAYSSSNPWTRPTHIGVADSEAPTNQFDGTIDEVAVYDYALAPEQILSHFNAGENGFEGSRSPGL